MHTTSIPESRCAAVRCGQKLDLATAFRHDRLPEPGDLLMCVHCLLVHRFNAALELEALTADEFEALPREVRDELAIATLRIRAEKRRRE